MLMLLEFGVSGTGLTRFCTFARLQSCGLFICSAGIELKGALLSLTQD